MDMIDGDECPPYPIIIYPSFPSYFATLYGRFIPYVHFASFQQTAHQTRLHDYCLPVVVITTKETTSAHIDVLLFFFLFLLLLLLLFSSRSSSGSSSGGSSTSTCPSEPRRTRTRRSQQVEDILSSQVRSEHHCPVRSDGVSRCLNELVEVLLLHMNTLFDSYRNLHLRISTNESSKSHNELFLFGSRQIIKWRHGC